MSASHRRELEIAEVLARHGMVYLVDILGLGRLLSLEQSLLGGGPRMQSHAPPEELRSALEELGPTFITLGQLISTRADLLSPDYLVELAKLQDAAPRVPAQVVQDVAGRELQRVEIQLSRLSTPSLWRARPSARRTPRRCTMGPRS
jgi:ubiquinone biosynthesis protein